MVNHLKDRYGDLNTRSKARAALHNLEQGGDSFSDFHIKFQEAAALLNLDKDDEMYELKQKLNGRYGSKVNDGIEYPSMAELVRRCRNLEDNFKTLDMKKPKADTARTDRARDGPSTRAAHNKRDTNRPPLATAEIPAKYKNLKPLTIEDRERFKKEGRCDRCREVGHAQFEKDRCPLGKFSYAQLNASATAFTPAPSATTTEETGKAKATVGAQQTVAQSQTSTQH